MRMLVRKKARQKEVRRAVKALEFALIVLACVIGSSILCQVVRRLSLPLVQIAVGCAAALLVPAVIVVIGSVFSKYEYDFAQLKVYEPDHVVH